MVTTRIPPDDDVLRFLGLAEVAEVRSGEVGFPPGLLYPYTADLRRVRAAFGGVRDHAPDAGRTLLAAIATLHGRIAFAPGPAGAAVADAYVATAKALSTNTELG